MGAKVRIAPKYFYALTKPTPILPPQSRRPGLNLLSRIAEKATPGPPASAKKDDCPIELPVGLST